jgi:predicted phosphodiesterase
MYHQEGEVLFANFFPKKVMRIRIWSDLHLEFWTKKEEFEDLLQKMVSQCSSVKADVLILAGDVVDRQHLETYFPHFIKTMKDHHNKIIFILGNHEYYFPTPEQEPNIHRDFKEMCEKLDIVLLENGTHKLENNLTIIGCTLWSIPSPFEYKRLSTALKLPYDDMININHNSTQFLKSTLEQKDGNKKYIVMTHYVPSFSFLQPKYRMKGEEYNSAHFSSCDFIFGNDNIYAWVYGHSHDRNIFKHNNIKFICNPFGYPEENGNYKYDFNQYDYILTN